MSNELMSNVIPLTALGLRNYSSLAFDVTRPTRHRPRCSQFLSVGVPVDES
jgi:hypothetical protein